MKKILETENKDETLNYYIFYDIILYTFVFQFNS
jgi:hypothetical protein